MKWLLEESHELLPFTNPLVESTAKLSKQRNQL